MIKNAPFRFSDFESITFSYGPPDRMFTTFDSKTTNYQYVNKSDSVVKTTLKLRQDDLLYLHRKAVEYGFWNFPDDMTVPGNTDSTANVMRFLLKFTYKEKSKQMIFDTNYPGDPKLRDAAKTMITEVQGILKDAEDRK
ncbi:hypothetical protein [Olivibacter ginsenosidimutans]